MTKSIAMAVVTVGGLFGSLYGALEPKPVAEVVEPAPETLDQQIERIAAQYGLPRGLAIAVKNQESKGDPLAVRYEKKWLPVAARYEKNKEKQQMLARSYGIMQVAGWWPHEAKAGTWADLLDPKYNIEFGCYLLAKAMERHAGVKSRYEQIRRAVRDYNGSGAMAEQYAAEVMQRYSSILIDRF